MFVTARLVIQEILGVFTDGENKADPCIPQQTVRVIRD